MSSTDTEVESSTGVTAATPATALVDKRPDTQRFLTQVLQHMECPAQFEFQDMADGSLGVKLTFETEVPGVVPGKRSFVIDSLQFLLNKVVNRPQQPRRWVNLGVGCFPEPRGARPPQVEREALPKKESNAQKGAPSTPPRREPNERRHEAAPPRHRHSHEPDERTLEAPNDKLLAKATLALVEKAKTHGRYYAIAMMPQELRAVVIQTAQKAKGARVHAEGERYMRRVVFTPENPKPMPKRSILPEFFEVEEVEDAKPAVVEID